MTILEFCNKYTISPPESAGFNDAAKFYAKSNFSEKLMILIYIKTFGRFPGGEDNVDGFSEIINEINYDIVGKISDETLNRKSADDALLEEIVLETIRRETADAGLLTDLNSEISNRETADTSLRNDLNSEISNRETADASLRNDLNSEISNRETADTSLQLALTGEISDRTSADDLKLDKASVVNSDSSTSTVDPVAAYQVKLLKDSITAILGILNSSNADLDTMQELVNFISTNKTTLDEYGTSKVNSGDIVNDLVSNISNKPASAATVFILKGLVDALTSVVSGKVDKITGKGLSTLDVTQAMLDAKSDTAHTHTKSQITDLAIERPYTTITLKPYIGGEKIDRNSIIYIQSWNFPASLDGKLLEGYICAVIEVKDDAKYFITGLINSNSTCFPSFTFYNKSFCKKGTDSVNVYGLPFLAKFANITRDNYYYPIIKIDSIVRDMSMLESANTATQIEIYMKFVYRESLINF